MSSSIEASLSNTIARWTRDGILNFKWGRFESFDKLTLNATIREKLQTCAQFFRQGESEFHKFQMPWRYGAFLYGPSGSGKTAAGKALARYMDWNHFTVPAHEILDSHLLERAFAELAHQRQSVIVLEDIDQIIRKMEPHVFFDLLDHMMVRAEGTFWIATSRHPELVPKMQLLRPGRFEESIRFDLPTIPLRKQMIQNLVPIEGLEWDESSLQEWVEQTEGLSYSHFEELRQLAARSKIENGATSEIWPVLKSYVEDQSIAGDRLGGLSDTTTQLNERVSHIDSRVLMAALDMTDVFRLLMEKVIGDAAEQVKSVSQGEKSN